MDIIRELRAIQNDLQMVKVARTRRNEEIPNEDRVAQKPNYDTVYFNHLNEVLHAPKSEAIDITYKRK